MKIGYARVSTPDQKMDLQIDKLKAAGCEKIFSEVVTGAKASRPELDKMLEQVRPSDIIVIWKLDRLGRSLKHLVELVGALIEKDVGLKSLHDPIDTSTSQGRLIFNIFASLAEFEREVISECTKAGLSAARARGRIGAQGCESSIWFETEDEALDALTTLEAQKKRRGYHLLPVQLRMF